jgi:hypothetical protein
VRQVHCGLGRLFLSPTAVLERIRPETVRTLQAHGEQGIPNLLRLATPQYDGRYPDQSRADLDEGSLGSLFDGLHRIPVVGYSVLAVLLAVVIGPLNLWLLWRRRRGALFYLTAPALAVAGMVVLGIYSVLDEGLGVKANEDLVLIHDLGTGEGLMVQARGLYAGLAVGALEYPAATLAIPHRTYRGDLPDYLETDISRGRTLVAGWVRSREESGVLTFTPVRVRLGLTVGRGPDGTPYLENGLPHAVSWAMVRVAEPDDDGSPAILFARDVAPGARAALTADDSVLSETRRRFGRRRSRALSPPTLDLPAMDWRVCAVVEDLPYREGGGVEVERLTSRAFYVSLAPPEEQP